MRRALLSTWLLFSLCLGVVPGMAAPPPSANVSSPAKSVLPFIEDDFAAARRQARETNRLLVVDAWATWCHSCLSMRNFVFTDPLLAPLAQRFVYLSIDTDLPRNADFVARFPISSWPTFLMLDVSGAEDGGRVVARYSGTLTAAEFSAQLTEAAAQAPLAEADAASMDGRLAAAAGLYAREAARKNEKTLPRARLGQIQALHRLGQYLACAELGDAVRAEVGWSAIATDFAANAANCLDNMTEFDTQVRLRRRLRHYLEGLVRDPRAPLMPDDRSDGYGTLVALADALGDFGGGDRYTEERLQVLESAAAQAKSPVEAATYDAHRLDCYRRFKRYAQAESMLLASQKVMPDDFNPPARLARLYLDMGRFQDALSSIDRALRLANGPARIAMLEFKSTIQHGLGQPRAALTTLEDAIRLAQPSSGMALPLKNKADALRKLLPLY